MEFPRIYLFDVNNLLLTIVFSMITTYMTIEFSRQIKRIGGLKRRNMVMYAFLIALGFWMTHLFVILSVDIPFSTKNYYVYLLFFFGFYVLAMYAALRMAQLEIANASQYMVSSLLIGSSLILADYTGFSILFKEAILLQPVKLFIAYILILGSSFSLLRLLMQMTNEDVYEFVRKWKFLGGFFGGLSLAGVPYLVLASMIPVPEGMGSNSLLAPYIFMATANFFFMLVPDLFGEKLIMKNVQSHLSLFNQNPDAVFRVDVKGYIMSVNKRATSLTGFSSEELSGLHFIHLIHGEEESKIKKYFVQVLSGETKVIETTLIREDSEPREVRITAVRIISKEKTVGIFGIVRDITEKRKAEKMIEYLAFHDELTKLPNRRNLEKKMGALHIEGQAFSLIYLDFDRFKRINDTFGHSFGDKVLVEIGKKLDKVVPKYSLVARIGGDEFAILVPRQESVRSIAENILEAFQTPVYAGGMEFLITASIGIASYPKDTKNLKLLLKYADTARYYAKENGANHIRFFEPRMVDHNVTKFELENDLRNAISNGELSVYYQPKYNSANNEMTGSEALARWNHPIHGMIPPGVFIPIAEESSLIVPLERFIITQVLQQLDLWKKIGFTVRRTSINVSIIHFYQEDFVKFIERALREFHLNGEMIEIEVTESIMIKKEDSINTQLQALRDMGIEVSIDDFGTGYSSLSYLSKLSVDRLKIDQSFIAHSLENKEIIAMIVSMANNLKLKVIAEGVETEEQIDLLKSLGCQEVQGYYYSPPLTPKEFEAIISHKTAVQS